MIIQRETQLPFPAADVWVWHMRPGAMERLIPPWIKATVVEAAPPADGSLAAVEIQLGLRRARWVVRHRDVIPGQRFSDEQVSGPFARWIHLHQFVDAPGGSVLRDKIDCRLPSGLNALVGHNVRERIERALRYRHDTLAADLALQRGVAPRRFVIAGAGGLIGSALLPFLMSGGHQVTRLVRRRPGEGEASWDPARGTLDPSALEGTDIVINLAGAGIADRRWSAARKRELVDSRVAATSLLARTIARLKRPPAAFVSVSGVGFYGDRGDEVLEDTSSRGNGFLADLAEQWEGAAREAADVTRVTHPRFGLVLSPRGGALGRMLLPFRLGVGGPLGHGGQWMSPASIDDTIDMIYRAALDDRLTGAFNAVGLEPVTSKAFARTLGAVLARPAILPGPAPALRLAFGELADEALLASQRAVPSALIAGGFPFRNPTFESALRHVLGRTGCAWLPPTPPDTRR